MPVSESILRKPNFGTNQDRSLAAVIICGHTVTLVKIMVYVYLIFREYFSFFKK